MKSRKRMKEDNLVLFILIIMLIAIALLVGASYGYEKGVIACKQYFLEYVNKSCICFDRYESYDFERPIPILNLSSS